MNSEPGQGAVGSLNRHRCIEGWGSLVADIAHAPAPLKRRFVNRPQHGQHFVVLVRHQDLIRCPESSPQGWTP